MYEYQDEAAARAWFAATTPEATSMRAFDASRYGDAEARARAVADLDEARKQAADLLDEFGLDLYSCGINVEALPRGLLHRPDARMRDYYKRTVPNRDTESWTYDSAHLVRIDGNAWTWLRPLLVELRELRKQRRQA